MTPSDVQKLVQELFATMGLEIMSDVSQDGDFFSINLTGKDTRFFERSRDNSTGALIVVLKTMIKQQFDTDPRLVIDFHGQRQERLQNVVLLAKKKAEMVRISGMEEEMPPMTPAERRAVHVALRDMTGIKTESRGEEPHRRIVIILNEDSE